MKWTAEQKKALRESIAHWERMREYGCPLPDDHEEPHSGYCACCELYADNLCEWCPVAICSESKHCDNTPWRQAAVAFSGFRRGHIEPDQWVRAATTEIDFLKKVLEAGE